MCHWGLSIILGVYFTRFSEGRERWVRAGTQRIEKEAFFLAKQN